MSLHSWGQGPVYTQLCDVIPHQTDTNFLWDEDMESLGFSSLLCSGIPYPADLADLAGKLVSWHGAAAQMVTLCLFVTSTESADPAPLGAKRAHDPSPIHADRA